VLDIRISPILLWENRPQLRRNKSLDIGIAAAHAHAIQPSTARCLPRANAFLRLWRARFTRE
jgi:hypothetical protein